MIDDLYPKWKSLMFQTRSGGRERASLDGTRLLEGQTPSPPQGQAAADTHTAAAERLPQGREFYVLN